MMIKYCLVLLFLAPCVTAQGATLQQLASNVGGEKEFADPELQDRIFDDSLLSEVERPSVAPREDEVRGLLDQQSEEKLEAAAIREDQVARAKRSTSLQSVNLYVKYFQYSDWYINYKSCCPRSQYYGCGVTRSLQHPCFLYNHSGRLEWCSIIYPTVYIYNCNCRTCVKQCPQPGCFATGRCYRRYTLQRMYAVCMRNGRWDHLHIFYRWIPTSCFCNARCG